MSKLSEAILLCAAIGACQTSSNNGPVVGGPCDYEETAGVATVVSVEAAGDLPRCGDNGIIRNGGVGSGRQGVVE